MVLRNDLTFFMFMNSMKDRRFNSCAFLGEQDIDLKFENMFDFVEIEDLKKKGYYMPVSYTHLHPDDTLPSF